MRLCLMSDRWPVRRTQIPGLTIGSGFYLEPLASGCAAKRGACSYMGARLTAWLVAPAIALVCFFFSGHAPLVLKNPQG